jgi:hypothetical protein
MDWASLSDRDCVAADELHVPMYTVCRIEAQSCSESMLRTSVVAFESALSLCASESVTVFPEELLVIPIILMTSAVTAAFPSFNSLTTIPHIALTIAATTVYKNIIL